MLLLVVVVAVPALVLTSCPANRDGISGQLASAKEETQSAARSGALALDLWQRGRSSQQLVGVQLADARDEVAKAYEQISVLKAENPQDLARQSLLTRSMTDIVSTLNEANGAVRGLPVGDAASLQQVLVETSSALDRGYQ